MRCAGPMKKAAATFSRPTSRASMPSAWRSKRRTNISFFRKSSRRSRLGPLVRQGDDAWFNVIKWTYYALLTAEEFGITQANVDEMAKTATNPEMQRILGIKNEDGSAAGFGTGIGLVGRMGCADRQGGGQLWRNLRAQRRPEHAAQDRARQECAVESRRPAIRSADPLIERSEVSGLAGHLSISQHKTGRPAVEGREALGAPSQDIGHDRRG